MTYPCDLCSHTSPTENGLRIHKRLSHGVKGLSHSVVACSACGTRMRYPSLGRHQRLRCTGQARKRGRPTTTRRVVLRVAAAHVAPPTPYGPAREPDTLFRDELLAAMEAV